MHNRFRTDIPFTGPDGRALQRVNAISALIWGLCNGELNGGQPSPESSRLFAYAERDVAQGDGWWRVQVLLTVELVSVEVFNLDVPQSFTESFIAPAHAAEPEPELCIFERLYETLLQVQGGGASSSGNAAASDGCGTYPGAPEAVMLQLVNFDDPNNATSGFVRAEFTPGPVVNIPVTPGGVPLFVNCGADACEIAGD